MVSTDIEHLLLAWAEKPCSLEHYRVIPHHETESKDSLSTSALSDSRQEESKSHEPKLL
jgi:hypothetical protein